MNHLQSRLSIFAVKGFSWYFLNCLFVTFGHGLCYIVMSWLIVEHFHSVSSMAILMACFWGPNVLLSPIFGAMADRFNRKHLLLIANGSRGLLLFVFWLLLNGTPNVNMIYLISLIEGTLCGLFIPSAMAFIREIVPKDKLLYANATLDIAYEVGSVVGMGSAGLVIAWTSMETAFLLNAICFFIGTFSLFLIPHKYVANTHIDKSKRLITAIVEDMKKGLRYLNQNAPLKIIYSIQMLLFVSYMIAPVLIAPYAKEILHTSVGDFGMIEAALSAGVILGGIFGPWAVDQYGMKRVLLVEGVLLGVSFAMFTVTQIYWLTVGLYALIGICFSAWPIIVTRAQELTEIDYQGRVQSTFNSLSSIIVMFMYTSMYFGGKIFTVQSMYLFEVIFAVIVCLLVVRSRRLIA